jgi:hypothetical protein
MNLTKKPHNFLLRPIDPDWLEKKVIESHEVDLRDRRTSAWRERIDERLKRLLRNNNPIDCESGQDECKKTYS